MGSAKITLELPTDLLTSLKIPKSELEDRAKDWVVLELFQEAKISAGKAGQILGISKVQFIELLNQHGLPYLDASAQELAQEIAAAESAADHAG